jgi:hypothetical protein
MESPWWLLSKGKMSEARMVQPVPLVNAGQSRSTGQLARQCHLSRMGSMLDNLQDHVIAHLGGIHDMNKLIQSMVTVRTGAIEGAVGPDGTRQSADHRPPCISEAWS